MKIHWNTWIILFTSQQYNIILLFVAFVISILNYIIRNQIVHRTTYIYTTYTFAVYLTCKSNWFSNLNCIVQYIYKYTAHSSQHIPQQIPIRHWITKKVYRNIHNIEEHIYSQSVRILINVLFCMYMLYVLFAVILYLLFEFVWCTR